MRRTGAGEDATREAGTASIGSADEHYGRARARAGRGERPGARGDRGDRGMVDAASIGARGRAERASGGARVAFVVTEISSIVRRLLVVVPSVPKIRVLGARGMAEAS